MKNQLVTIGIISFNNEDYIRECIESCLAQTYPNVEIIIADDGSTDLSPEIISEYVQKYPNKIKAVLIKTNAGIASNFNQAVKIAKGDWFKSIACDDVLMPECIDLYMNEINKKNIKSGILFGRVLAFETFNNLEKVSNIPLFFELNENQRLQSLLLMNTLSAPSAFFKTSTLFELGLADERYPFLEDYPLWIKAQLSGVGMYFVNAITVKYRQHESITSSKYYIGHLGYYQSFLKFSKEVVWPLRHGFIRLKSIEEFFHIKRIILSIKWFNNKKNLMYRVLETCTKPFKLYSISVRIYNFIGFKNEVQ